MDKQLDIVKDDLLISLLSEDKEGAIKIAKETLLYGVSAEQFFELCITPVLIEIGERFKRLDIFLPEMVEAAEIVQSVNKEVLRPRIEKSGSEIIESKGKILLATIKGDLHDIGKNMVNLMLTVSGFEVIDLGVDVTPERIVERAQQEKVDIIGMSSLLTSCLPFMKDVVDLLTSRGQRDKYKIIIGGAAPSAEFANQIGANAQGHTAADAVDICNNLLKSP